MKVIDKLLSTKSTTDANKEKSVSSFSFLTENVFSELLKLNDNLPAEADLPGVDDNPDDNQNGMLKGDDAGAAAYEAFSSLEQMIAEITQNQASYIHHQQLPAESSSAKDQELLLGSRQPEVSQKLPISVPIIAVESAVASKPIDALTSPQVPQEKPETNVLGADQRFSISSKSVLSSSLINDLASENMPHENQSDSDAGVAEFDSVSKNLTQKNYKLTAKISLPMLDNPEITESREYKEVLSNVSVGLKMNKLGSKVDAAENEAQFGKVNLLLNQWASEVNESQRALDTMKETRIDILASHQLNHQAKIMNSISDGQAKQGVSSTNTAFYIDSIDTIQEFNPEKTTVGMYHATIKVNPPELGPITAKIRIDKKKAILDILVKDSRIGDIVRAYLPELKEQFNQSSLHVETINIQDMPLSQQERQDESFSNPKEQADTLPNLPSNTLKNSENRRKNPDALIDAYI